MAPPEPQPPENRLQAEVVELLARASEGDQAAWRTLIEAYSPRVFGLVRAHCADADLAEEITQSTFCTVAAKLGEYEESGRFESWIFRIAMNRLRDEMRRRKRHAVPMAGEPLAQTAAPPAPASARTDGRPGPTSEASRVLVQALASLSESDREVINLRHVGGLSFKQMADTLEEPLGTLLARHHRALRKLRDYLEERGVQAESIL